MTKAVAKRKEGAPAKVTTMRQAAGQEELLGGLMEAAKRADLPARLSPERLAKCALILLQKNPKLYDCTRSSFFLALIDAGMAGLEPDGQYGTIVGYKNKEGITEAQFQTMWRGDVELARRSGHVYGIEADTVHEGDVFSWEKGLHKKLVHVPSPDVDRTAETLTHAYAIVRMKEGPDDFEVLNKARIEAVRKKSRATTGPWFNPWEYPEMARKTVIRVLKKRLPSSYEDRRLIEAEEALEYEGRAIGTAAAMLEPPAPPPSKTEALLKKVGGGKLQAPEPEPEPEREPPEDLGEAEEVEEEPETPERAVPAGESDEGEGPGEDEPAEQYVFQMEEGSTLIAIVDTATGEVVASKLTTRQAYEKLGELEAIAAELEPYRKRYFALAREVAPHWTKDPEKRRAFQVALCGKGSTKAWAAEDFLKGIEELEKRAREQHQEREKKRGRK